MGLESASFISGLSTSNPAAGDEKQYGDDHLRLIKQVLKNTFPNLGFAVTFSSFAATYLDENSATSVLGTLSAAGTGIANTFTATQTFSFSDNGAGPQYIFDLRSASTTPVGNDYLVEQRFIGANDALADTVFASFGSMIGDPSAGSEDGEFYIRTAVGGALDRRLRVGAGLFSKSATGGDKGVDTANFAAFYINGEGPFAPPTMGTAGQVLRSTGLTTTPSFAWSGEVQTAYTQSSDEAHGTTTIPLDTSKPQIGEGDQYLSCAITPKSATNILEIEALVNFALSSATPSGIAAIFKDSDADAIASGVQDVAAINSLSQLRIHFFIVAGSTTARTYTLRAGPSTAATMTVNGTAAAGKLNGTIFSYLKVRELGA